MATKRKPRKVPNRWLVLALVAIAQFIVVVDITIVNVALPSMQRALEITPTNLQWIITAYTLCFGGFLLLGGRSADILGRKLIFIIGLVAFSLGSLAVGLAQDESQVIIARGFQGLAGAFMSPAALAVILDTFAEGKERNKALGVWGGVASAGGAVGLLLGGLLTQYLNWRWNFFVNVPIGLVVAVLSWRILHESKANLGHRQFDIFGAVTVTGGLMLLVYALTKAPEYGWTDERTLAMIGAALGALAIFLFNEEKRKYPLMPLAIFRVKNVGKSNMVIFPVVASMFAMFFFVTLYVQNILGYSPVKTGLSFLPVALTIGVFAGLTSNLVNKIGYKPFMVAGPAMVGVGLFLLTSLPVKGEYVSDILIPLVAVAAGMGMAFVSVTIGATTGVQKRDSGLASGILNTTQQVGGALGLAILSSVAASATTSHLEDLKSRPTPIDQVTAMVEGFHAAFWAGTVMAAIGAIIALVLIKQRKGEKIDTSSLTPG